MYKKILSFSVVLFVIAGCTQLSFNERFNQAKWNKVIIAPFEGELAPIAEEEFEHALAISSKLIVIPSSIIRNSLKKFKLDEMYNTEPNEAIFMLSLKMGADGVIFAKVKTNSPKSKHRSDIVSSSASIYAKLVDVKSRTIVASSQHDSTSIFSGTNQMVQDVSQNAIEDFQLFFDKINGG